MTHTIAPHLSPEQLIHMALTAPFDQPTFDLLMAEVPTEALRSTGSHTKVAVQAYARCAKNAARLVAVQRMAATETEGE